MTSHLNDPARDRFSELRSTLAGVKSAPRRPDAGQATPGPIDPMLAESYDGDLAEVDEATWLAERKFDGTRIVLQRFDDDVHLYTRRHIDRAQTLDRLADHARTTLPNGLILDGEYCYLTPEGRSRFVPIHQADGVVEDEHLTGRYFVFDILARDGRWCTNRSVVERKALLADAMPSSELCPLVPGVTEGFSTFFEELTEQGEEGIMLKRRASPYYRGRRSAHWQKVKAFTETDVVIVGYTEGKGARADTFGALVMTDGTTYVGRVGSGFAESDLRTLRSEMDPIESYPIPPDEVNRPYTPVEPFVVSVKYQEVNSRGKLRAPVFLRTRPDKPIEDVLPIEAKHQG